MTAAPSRSTAPLKPRERALVCAEALTVGLPFCVFKVACAVYVMGPTVVGALGFALLALGVADGALNVINALSVAVVARRVLPVCCLQAIALRFRSRRAGEVGTAADTMLSFGLVAAMIGTGAIAGLARPWSTGWSVAVVLNVLGAGGLRFAEALAPRG